MQNLDMELVKRLRKDLKAASKVLEHNEARALVDMYYTVQASRIATGNQVAAISRVNKETGEIREPSMVLLWFKDQYHELERNIAKSLDFYSNNHQISIWARKVIGIGPVLASGLMANLDITKAPTVGAFWRFAGLDPSITWDKGKKRPWNASLKVVCWKIGESFVKVSGNEKSLYGRIYRERRALETAKNEELAYKDQAEAALARKNYKKSTEAYKSYIKGMLPSKHIMNRAQRYAVKLFLSHLFAYWYEKEYGKKAPAPYCFEHLGHIHEIAPEVKGDGCEQKQAV